MGNSCGDIAEYWEMIYDNPQCMGAFVWEWADHAIKTKKGLMYGGDFGEKEHDGNFCCDGLLTADRKIKSSALEMKAVYGGKLKSSVVDVKIPEFSGKAKSIDIDIDEDTGALSSIKVDGKEILKAPMRWNIWRYTDNDRNLVYVWENRYLLSRAKPEVLSLNKTKNGYEIEIAMCANVVCPAVTFKVEYVVNGNKLEIKLDYSVGDYIESLPRFGFELLVDKEYEKFDFIGFGRTESYIDKNVACEYGLYQSTASDNYDYNYVRPQESGSHYLSKYLKMNGLFYLTAKKPFSFSVNPYTTKQLIDTKHNFELKKNDFNVVCVDLAMRGVGSHSCGPKLPKQYEIPRQENNVFVLEF
jgi:hypothetical protein